MSEYQPKRTESREVAAAAVCDASTVEALCRACHQRMGSPLGEADLEEVIQETWITTWQKRGTFRGGSCLETWIYGIATYKVMQQIRKRVRHNDRESSWADVGIDPVDPGRGPASAADTGLGRVVRQQLSTSGSTVGAIFVARDVDGLGFREIGLRLNLSEAAAKARYYRNLGGLRARLQRLWLDMQRAI